MDELKTAEQIRDYILNWRGEGEDEVFGSHVSPCYSLSWKRDHWVVKENRKKIGIIEAKMLPRGFDMRTRGFLEDSLAILRKGGLKALGTYLKALKRRAREEE